MTTYAAFLRAVNVGGTGKLAMSELRAMCESLGFTNVRTYIASGNVVFETRFSEASVKARLGQCLDAYAGKPVGVLVRTAAELAAVLAANPFSAAPPDRTVAIFLDSAPTAQILENVAVSTRKKSRWVSAKFTCTTRRASGDRNSRFRVLLKARRAT